MPIVKILGTADNHLRDRQFARADRGHDFRRAVEHIVDLAIDLKVESLLIAGDLLDTVRPSANIVSFVRRMHEKMVDQHVRGLLISGNHDRTNPHWISAVAPLGCCPNGGIELIDHTTVTLPSGLKVRGVPYMQADAFRELYPKDKEVDCDIMMFHGLVKDFVGFPVDNALTIEDFPPGPQLFFLGDIHIRDWRQNTRGQWIGYPGSSELCNRGEEFEKSVELIRIDTERKTPVEIEKIVIPTRKALAYRILEEDDVEDVLEKVQEHVADNPMIFLRFNPQVNNVIKRLRTILDPDKALIRAASIGRIDNTLSFDRSEKHELRGADYFLDRFFVPGTDLFETASLLVDETIIANDVIDAYIAKRTNKNDDYDIKKD